MDDDAITLPEIREQSGELTPRPGTFPKGVSGNPGGRNPEREALRKWLMAEYGRKSVEAIAKLAQEARSEKVRLDAHIWLAEQAIGKAVQGVDLTDSDGNPMSVGIIILPAAASSDGDR